MSEKRAETQFPREIRNLFPSRESRPFSVHFLGNYGRNISVSIRGFSSNFRQYKAYSGVIWRGSSMPSLNGLGLEIRDSPFDAYCHTESCTRYVYKKPYLLWIDRYVVLRCIPNGLNYDRSTVIVFVVSGEDGTIPEFNTVEY